jgi:hypothetical protein
MDKYIYIGGILLGYSLLHGYFNYSAQITGDTFYNNKNNPEVYDVLHKILPNYDQKDWLTDYMALIAFIPLILNFNQEFMLEFIGFIIVVYLIRDVIINLTILPKHINCSIKKEKMSHYEYFIGGCYDKIFSGHFSLTMMLTLLYYTYGYVTNIPLLVGWNLINGLIIISTRSHYTIDVVMAMFVCLTVFTNDIKIPFNKLIN